MAHWRVEEEDATTPSQLVRSGALSPAPGHSLTLSARRDIGMCLGPLRMECISWGEGTTATAGPQNW